MTDDVLSRLLALDLSEGPLLILTHENPDPDSLASAAALRHLLKETRGIDATIGYSGIIGRAENRAMVKLLNLGASHINELDIDSFRYYALIDAQPLTGNTALGPEKNIDIVIDHHPLRESTARARFADVRQNVGASATMLTEYLRAADVEIPSNIATALLYGVRSETQDLGRETSPADREAYQFLFQIADGEKLATISKPPLERHYFLQMAEALDSVRLGGRVAICTLGEVIEPDFVPEMADFIVRMKEIEWAFVHGYFEGRLYLSIRTDDVHAAAGEVMQQILKGLGKGGGHGMRAGGNIILDEVIGTREDLEAEIDFRFLDLLGEKRQELQPLRPRSEVCTSSLETSAEPKHSFS
jgi:nanoRNase/pAp phosphatase (c-di-AMP/oligoRNAs hydrolase)